MEYYLNIKRAIYSGPPDIRKEKQPLIKLTCNKSSGKSFGCGDVKRRRSSGDI